MFRNLFFCVLCICGFAMTAQTVYTVESIPKPFPPDSYVSNPDGVLSGATESDLNTVLRGLEESTTAQVAVAVVQSIGDEVPGDFRTKLFRHWGIGQAENNNGLLILLVMDQRRMEFEVGYGLEGVLPDILCKHIQETFMVPLAKQGDIDGAVRAGVSQVVIVLTNPAYREEIYAQSLTSGQSVSMWRQPTTPVLLILFAVIYFVSAFTGFRNREKSLKKAPAYVSHNYNHTYATTKFGLLNLALPLGFYAFQELTGTFRMFEFLLFVYGLMMILLLEKRIRLNRYIVKEHAADAPQETYMEMARSHSKGWLFATIFFPFPFLLYDLFKRATLRKYRYTAPLSADGVTPMTLHNEKADDAFLKAYELVEEKLRSVDYDVWENSQTQERKIFRFENYFSKYKPCPSCNSKAYAMTKNVTLVSPTYTSTGTGEKTYSCKACNHSHKESYVIAKLVKSSSSGSGSGFSGGGGGGFGGGSSGGGGAGSSW